MMVPFGPLQWYRFERYDGTVCSDIVVPIRRYYQLRFIKTDKADAIKIAIYCYLYREQLKLTKLPSPALQQLRRLVSERRSYIVSKKGFSTRRSEAYPEESDATLSRQGRQINYLEDSIQEVNKEILSLINGDKKLLRSYQLLTSIPGVGQVVASNTIAYSKRPILAYALFGDLLMKIVKKIGQKINDF